MTDEANITQDAADVKLQMTGTAKPITPEVGKYYRLRNGDVVGPIQKNSSATYIFTSNNKTWDNIGRYFYGSLHHFDIIAKAKTPAKPIKTKDLRKIDVPFGELSPEMQAALKDHGGPYEARSLSSDWFQIFEPYWTEGFIYRVSPKSAKDPNRPRPAHKLGLTPGDKVELVKWEDKYLGYEGMIFVVSADGTRVDHDGGISYQIPCILRKGNRPLFRVISRAADRVSAESGAATPFGVAHFNPKTGDVFSPIWTDAGKIWTVGKEYVWYGNLDGVQGSDGRLGCFCDRAKWRLVRRAPCPTCGQERKL
jgi:hypothetical protein